MTPRIWLRLLLFMLLVGLGGSASVHAQSSDLQVVATTSIIRDVAQNVAGDLFEVTSIIPQGADTHSYTPTPAEVFEITEADVVLVNGAFLEESLLEIIEENAPVQLTIVSNGVEVLSSSGHHHDDEEDADLSATEADEDAGTVEVLGILGEDLECTHEDEEEIEEAEGEEENHAPCDPHFWTNPANVIIWTNNIADAFISVDPDNADSYRANADVYIEQLNTLLVDIDAQVQTIPVEERVIVTNHDFLGYFAYAYEFEVVGLVIPAISTLAEPNPQDLVALVEEIEEEGVRAIFVETTSPADLAETVANEVGYDVQVVELYSETLSDTDEPASTYLDYIRFNVNAIVSALGAM